MRVQRSLLGRVKRRDGLPSVFQRGRSEFFGRHPVKREVNQHLEDLEAPKLMEKRAAARDAN